MLADPNVITTGDPTPIGSPGGAANKPQSGTVASPLPAPAAMLPPAPVKVPTTPTGNTIGDPMPSAMTLPKPPGPAGNPTGATTAPGVPATTPSSATAGGYDPMHPLANTPFDPVNLAGQGAVDQLKGLSPGLTPGGGGTTGTAATPAPTVSPAGGWAPIPQLPPGATLPQATGGTVVPGELGNPAAPSAGSTSTTKATGFGVGSNGVRYPIDAKGQPLTDAQGRALAYKPDGSMAPVLGTPIAGADINFAPSAAAPAQMPAGYTPPPIQTEPVTQPPAGLALAPSAAATPAPPPGFAAPSQSPSVYTGAMQNLGGGMSAPTYTPQANEAATMGIDLNSPTWYAQYQAIKGGAANPNTVTTLQNGVLSTNGKPVGVTNSSGAVVDPTTGKLTSAGGLVAAQAKNSDGQTVAGLPPSVNGMPIVQWMQSQGLIPGGTPDANGVLPPASGPAAGGGSPGAAPTSTGPAGASVAPGLAAPSPSSSTAAAGGGASGSPTIPIASPGSSSNVQNLLDSATNNMANVDRVGLAKSYFDQIAKEAKPQFALQDQLLAHQNATMGRAGSGMLRNQFGTQAQNQDTMLTNALADLTNQATTGSIQDSFNKVGALSNLQQTNFGQANTLDQEAINNAIQQYDQQLAAQQQEFNQGSTMTGLGLTGNPATLDLSAAGQLLSQPSAAGRLAQQMGYGGGAYTGGAPATVPESYTAVDNALLNGTKLPGASAIPTKATPMIDPATLAKLGLSGLTIS